MTIVSTSAARSMRSRSARAAAAWRANASRTRASPVSTTYRSPVSASSSSTRPTSGSARGLQLRHAPEDRRGAHVDHQHHRELALFGVALHVRHARPRGDVPVDGADLVAGLVEPHFGELHAAALEDALVLAREHVGD